MSIATAGQPIRRRALLMAGLAALVAFIIPISIVNWLDDPPPEVRVLATDDGISALIVDRDARLLVIDTADREAAGTFLGRIAQPWEPDPRTIVASSDDDAAIGLWEALQRLDPASVVVAGVPGADPLWSAIDDVCSDRQIDLHYVTDSVTLATDRLSLQITGIPLGAKGGRGIAIRRSSTSVVLALDTVVPNLDGQVLVSNGPQPQTTVDLLVTDNDEPRLAAQYMVLVSDRRVVQLELHAESVHVFGGSLRTPKE